MLYSVPDSLAQDSEKKSRPEHGMCDQTTFALLVSELPPLAFRRVFDRFVSVAGLRREEDLWGWFCRMLVRGCGRWAVLPSSSLGLALSVLAACRLGDCRGQLAEGGGEAGHWPVDLEGGVWIVEATSKQASTRCKAVLPYVGFPGCAAH